MNKYFAVLIATLLIDSTCFAGLISHTDYVSGNSITAAGQNANENTIVTLVNGNIDSSNIATGGITSTNILDATIAVADLSPAVTGKFMTAGLFMWWVGTKSTVPTGWLYCDGSAVSRTTYSDLFAVIGTKFGQGDNSTTFNLPDTRGYFVRGQADGQSTDPDAASRTAPTTGASTGDNVGSVQVSTVSAHTHAIAITDPGHNHALPISNGAGATFIVGQAVTTVATQNASPSVATNTTGITAASVANGSATETRPRNIYMVGIVKY